jgi:hypothetical protein
MNSELGGGGVGKKNEAGEGVDEILDVVISFDLLCYCCFELGRGKHRHITHFALHGQAAKKQVCS